MRTSEDDKPGSDRSSGNGNVDKDDKPAESPSTGEMVIDESPSQPTQPPPPTSTTFYPYNALGVQVHTGMPQPPPPSATSSANVSKSEHMQGEFVPLMSDKYEPLSDEDWWDSNKNLSKNDNEKLFVLVNVN